MSETYLGEIRMFAGNFAPCRWALCNGQTTFALPDLQGRVAVHPNHTVGKKQVIRRLH
ncbi:tail fiber protein [Paenibacillus xylanexedens]|uniref:phage tail protein n=1 Tax=Paenibacillus xylanexedens TaxID=528191 RepID=UPI0028E5BD21|nr:tail fiber protein [Paenibacillus xylanexedens]